jgi:hypothetical protein
MLGYKRSPKKAARKERKMTRVIAKEEWLKTLDLVVYHKHLGGGWWLADIELHHLISPA